MRTQLQLKINKVNAEEIRSLRHSELRKGQDFSTTSYLKDHDSDTFHMACILIEVVFSYFNTYIFSFCKKLKGFKSSFTTYS